MTALEDLRRKIDVLHFIFIFIHHNMVKKNRKKYSNKNEAQKYTYTGYHIRRKS